MKSEAKIAEVKALELRKIDFETLERDLLEFQQALEERERALTPDKTSADLTWIGEREADVIGGETNRVRRVKKVSPENDPSLPRATRSLARTDRLVAEAQASRFGRSRDRLVQTLEKLWLAAYREDRVVDADFYFKTLRTLYPDWEYQPKEEKKK
jgi:hypothetical protein